MTAEFTLAVHALVYLLHKGTVVSSGELAENICTNPARVRKVMAKLHRAGLTDSGQGKGSGYCWRPENGELPLDRVLFALNEKPVSAHWRSGDVEMDCLVSSGMGEIMDKVYAEMNEACVGRLSGITVGGICRRLFSEGGAKP